MPIVKPTFDTSLADASIKLADKWIKDDGIGSLESDVAGWSSDQLAVFLDNLIDKSSDAKKPLQHPILDKLGSVYKLIQSNNSEIRFRYYTLCIRSNYEKIFPLVVDFLTHQGRMKFTRPLYRNLYNSGETGKALAVKTFLEHKSFYHNICAKLVAKDLHLT